MNRAERKQDAFVRLAEKRVNGILDGIRVLKGLANRNNYEYTDQQVSKIFKELKKAIRDAEQAFASGDSAHENRFRL